MGEEVICSVISPQLMGLEASAVMSHHALRISQWLGRGLSAKIGLLVSASYSSCFSIPRPDGFWIPGLLWSARLPLSWGLDLAPGAWSCSCWWLCYLSNGPYWTSDSSPALSWVPARPLNPSRSQKATLSPCVPSAPWLFLTLQCIKVIPFKS